MTPLGSFIAGMGVGAIITFFTIILFAKTMEKGQKDIYITRAKKKWSKK